MSPKKSYERNKPGERIEFHGIDTVHPPDNIPNKKVPYAQNVRAYQRDSVTGRASQDSSVATLPTGVHSLRRLNDSTPAGPPAGFILVVGAGTNLYANATQVDSGLSGNPISIVPFRPNTSVQPWAYVGDSVKMDKVRSDGTCYAMGIAEPQAAPSITATPVTVAVSLIGPVTVYVWSSTAANANQPGQYIWKNASDTGSGPVLELGTQLLTTVGNSLIFDRINGGGGAPVAWTTYTENIGTVSTDDIGGTHNVHWVNGNDFGNMAAGYTILIGATSYTILTVVSNILLHLTVSAGTQTNVAYQSVNQSGTVPLFQPPVNSSGYANFNCAIVCTLYIPAAGTYTFSTRFKDDIIWGIGGNAAGTASWSDISTVGTYFGALSFAGQTKTALNGYPLMPRNPDEFDGGSGFGEAGTQGGGSVAVTFSAPGNYQFEIGWDYWYHSGRQMTIQCNGVDIAPIPAAVITESQYRYTYRSSATGATSNPSPASPVQALSVLSNSLTATPSSDPQVDKIDFYRLDLGLQNYTYVGTGSNSSAAFSDQLLDADVAANPILDFDNFQPFPSIDLPRKGVVNVANGVASWVSGDTFNVRWLPGTIVIVGTVAYAFDKRPTSSTNFTATYTEIIGGVSTIVPLQTGTNLTFEIDEPILAEQRLPYLWGPTDNVSFALAVGDPLRPGTLYWCKGNNLDSAPDTNQQDITSPSEPLQNGCIVNGLSLVFSTERAFLTYPNFFNALATVNGTEGSTWTIQESISTRGLYMPRALAVDGGGNVFFRAKDGVFHSPGGQGAKSITDDDLYNIFPHEGMIPQPVTRGGFTVYPPDDTKPQAQKMNVANGYLYYDYQDTSGIARTLVFDIAAMGWVVDVYQYPVIVHALEEGAGVNGTLTGNTDGSVRPLKTNGIETGCAIVLTRCETAGDVRASKHWGDLYVEAGPKGS